MLSPSPRRPRMTHGLRQISKAAEAPIAEVLSKRSKVRALGPYCDDEVRSRQKPAVLESSFRSVRSLSLGLLRLIAVRGLLDSHGDITHFSFVFAVG